MKKLTAVILAAAMILTLFAGCSKSEPVETSPVQTLPASALEILETVWGGFADDEKFPVIGGNIEANIMDAPGSYDLAYAENMTWNLLVPEDQIANITEAASMIHMMNANTFTCGAFRLAEGVTAADFASAMQQAVQGNQWMCGFPDSLQIYGFADTYVVVAFGVESAMTPFATHMSAAYPDCVALYNEAIG